MVISKKGKGIVVDGMEFNVGEEVAANDRSHYQGLVGTITEIRTGLDKDTENFTDDIYVSFEECEVIMASDMIIPIKYCF